MSEVDILGIDLGTTNSAIAIWEVDTGKARVLHNSEGDRLTPSVVMFDTQSSQPIVGKLALGRMTSHPSQVVYSVKRRIERGLFRVKATSGDTRLGGDDFDQTIMGWMQEAFQQQHGIDLPVEQNNRLQTDILSVLRKTAEDAKIALTQATEYTVNIPNLLTLENRSLGLEATLTRDELGKLIQAFIKRTLDICEHTLECARLSPKDIDQVLLVGGQTRSPAIKAALRDHFSWKINDSVNPDEAVARGAAVLGGRLCGYLRDEVKLWDVTPLSLGIELANSKMDPIIKANEQIPVTKWRKEPQAFTTQRDGQESIRFRIYQGERPIATDNEFIGEVVLNLETPCPAGKVRVNCMFKVDHDGILHVSAQDISSDGKSVEKTFDRFYRLTPEEVEQKLKEAQVHQNEDTITSHVFQLEEELTQIKRVINKNNKDNASENLLLEIVQDLESAINKRDVTQAERLLAELKIKIIT